MQLSWTFYNYQIHTTRCILRSVKVSKNYPDQIWLHTILAAYTPFITLNFMFGVTLGYYNAEYRPFTVVDDFLDDCQTFCQWWFNQTFGTLISLRKIYFFAQLTSCRAIFHLQKSKGYQINGNCLSFPQNIRNLSYDHWERRYLTTKWSG